jgi:type I restriction enzyme R subunit
MKNMSGVMAMLYDHPALRAPLQRRELVKSNTAATTAQDDNFGKRRAGVVWHTQGSGKSLSMVFYSGKLITTPEMQNPTIVVITDRNDLDDQLFDTSSSVQLLRQEPIQAEIQRTLKGTIKSSKWWHCIYHHTKVFT